MEALVTCLPYFCVHPWGSGLLRQDRVLHSGSQNTNLQTGMESWVCIFHSEIVETLVVWEGALCTRQTLDKMEVICACAQP
jgi:hypothetical protein